jgi:hypothetical chaperone protein
MPQSLKDSQKVVYAIDYGTSNSLLAAVDEKGQKVILPIDADAPDPSVLRSVLYFQDQDTCFYGHRAVKEYQEQEGAGRLIRSIKKFLPSTSYVGSHIENRVVRLEDLIGLFLMEMRKRANTLLDRDVNEVLIGRPAKYSFKEEEDKMAEHRMAKAAEFAGFQRVEFLAEPVAAAFDLKERITEEVKVLVVDLGGGTSDFSVVRFRPGAFDKERDLLAIGGISKAGDAFDGQFMRKLVAPHLGSEVSYRVPMGRNTQKMPTILAESIASPADIVQLRLSQVMNFFRKVKDWTLSDEDRDKLERLVVLVEDNLGFKIFERIGDCKQELGTSDSSRFKMNDPGIELEFDVTRQMYSTATQVVLGAIMSEMEETLSMAGLKNEDIDYVYCTGGTSKLFTLGKAMAARFPKEKVAPAHFFHSVIQGLAVQAHRSLF